MAFGFLLPILLWILTCNILANRFDGKLLSGERGLVGAVLIGVVIVASIELLNAFHLLTTAWMVAAWIVAIGCALFLLYRSRQTISPQEVASLRFLLQEAGWESRLMALGIFVLVTILGLTAVAAVPNNWDSMGYHLTRVAYWRQYQSVSFFATNNPRQNNLPPFAEWAIFELGLLQGKIALSNTVQWLSYTGCILAVGVISRLLGGSTRESMISAFFCATLPLAILESTSNQNDLVLSFWLAVTVYGCIKSSTTTSWLPVVVTGAALGLAMLTKSTVTLFAPLILAWLCWCFFPKGWKYLVARLAVIGAIFLAVNAGHWLRNTEMGGSPFGPNGTTGHEYTNEIHTPVALLSNVIRNLAVHGEIAEHGATPTTKIVVAIHRWLHFDPLDPRTTLWPPNNAGVFVRFLAEDSCAMPIHLLAIAGSFVVVFFARSRYDFSCRALILTLFIGAFLLCFVLKWQIWIARFQLPFFVLASPIVAAVLERQFAAWVRWCFLVLIFTGSLSYATYKSFRPALGHRSVFTASAEAQRFFNTGPLLQPYRESLRILREAHVQKVGLFTENSWEYPLLDPKQDGSPPEFSFDHVLVSGLYAPLEKTATCDAIVTMNVAAQTSITVDGKKFGNVYQSVETEEGLPYIAVFLPVEQAELKGAPDPSQPR